MMREFKPGDRVWQRAADDRVPFNASGIVQSVGGGSVLVAWDDFHVGHSGSTETDRRDCWYVFPDDLGRIVEAPRHG